VETTIDDRGADSDRISNKAVLSAIPWPAHLTFEVSLHVLVKASWVPVEKTLIFGRQNEHWLLALNEVRDEQKISKEAVE
jgi:hypothetical protein